MANDIFKRVEVKYRLSKEQYDLIRLRLEPYMQDDEYGLSTIQSIYYDSEKYDLIRESLEKPVYKEKLRLRAYGTDVNDDTRVYLELKKKYEGIVYKRRISLSYKEAIDYMEKGRYPETDSQILKEIDYFMVYYRPTNRTYISYDRIAMFGKENPDLRITFDKNIRCEFNKMNFESSDNYKDLLKPGERLMEIKVPGAMPLWMASILSELKIYPSSFSKYGTASKQFLTFDTINNNSFIYEGEENVRKYIVGNRLRNTYA